MSARAASTLVKCVRGIAKSAPRSNDEVHPGYKKIQKISQKFLIDDGIPVYLKGGPLDRILYGATMGLCLVGLGMNFKLYYELSLK